ncbi:MAG: hypothetical protein MMC23_006102 [Stictis urceolatum]|nr:hypothetical protein [Stictis urceolata]
MSMFGALNRFISRLDADGPQSSTSPNNSECGFQVLRNTNTSILLEPWYDFIVGINGRQIDNPDPHLFSQEVRNCAGAAVNLTLWNAKGHKHRTLSLPLPTPLPTLGLTLQWTPLSSTSSTWHILDIAPNSPADKAGLLPYGDYIIGSPEGLVRGEPGLGELVEDYLSRPLRLWVCNHEYGVTRLVTITPSRAWGGEGALGCVLGFGALHRLPPSLEEPPVAPGETLFETARFSNEEERKGGGAGMGGTGGHNGQSGLGEQTEPARSRSASPEKCAFEGAGAYQGSNLMVPASLSSAPPMVLGSSGAGSPAPVAGRKKRAGKRPSGFDEMWEEGAEKSKEEDFVPKAKTPPPPPPKVSGGPPQGAGARFGETLRVPGQEERTQTASPDPIIEDEDGDVD